MNILLFQVHIVLQASKNAELMNVIQMLIVQSQIEDVHPKNFVKYVPVIQIVQVVVIHIA